MKYFNKLILFIFILFNFADLQGQVIIGTGTSVQRYPFSYYFGYGRDATIYSAAEMNTVSTGGTITTLGWNSSIASTVVGPTKIYLKTVGSTTAITSQSWALTIAGATEVYSGTPASWVIGYNTIDITDFAIPANTNLIVLVECNFTGGGTGTSTGTQFRYTNGAANSHGSWEADTNPPTGNPTRNAQRPNITLGGLAPLTCFSPTALTSSAITTSTATISWTASVPPPANGYDYYYSTTNTSPTSMTTPSGSTTVGVTTANLTMLIGSTTYYFWARGNCGSGDFSAWSTGASFTTACSATTIPYTQDFESVTIPAIPTCTSIQNAGTGNNWITSSNPGSGFTSKTLQYSYNSSNAANAWFYTQGLTLNTGTTYKLTYRYGNNGFTEKLKVALGTSADFSSMITIADHPSVTGSVPITNTVTITVPSNGTYYVGFNAYSAANQFYLFVDDISIIVAPSCDVPTAIVASAITATSATISWTAPISAPAMGYEYIYSTSSTPPNSGSFPSGSTSPGVLTANISSLTSNTLYYVWVRSVCSAIDQSTWAALPTFTTLPLPPANDESSGAINLTVNADYNCGMSASGTTFGATQSLEGAPTCSATGINDDVWYTFIATGTSHRIGVTGTSSTTAVALYTGTPGSLVFLTGACASNTLDATGLVATTTYYVRVYTTSAVAGTRSNFVICVGTPPPPPVNDECATAIVLTATNGLPTNIVVGDVGGATASVGVPTGSCSTFSNTLDVWYTFNVPASGNALVELFAVGGTSNGDNDYSLQAFSGSCGTLVYVSCDEDGSDYPTPSDYLPSLSLSAQTPGNPIYLRVRKSTSSSQNKFSIGVSDPTVLIPIATGECLPSSVTISPASGNAFRFVPLLDASGGIVAEVYPYGQDLGVVSSSVHHNVGAVRTDGNGIKYMDVDHKISVTIQPTVAVDIALYVSASDLSLLMAADPAVTGIGDIKTTKTDNACGSNPSTGGTLLSNYASFTRTDGVAAVAFSPASFSNFYLHGGLTPLPVNILSFDAKALNNKTVQLTWNVAAEVDVKEYIVERSNDNRNWSAIGTVKASQKSTYGFNDNSPASGVNYYRLAIKDVNASVAFSDIRSVNFSGKGNMALYPNPANNTLFVSGTDDKNVVISIYNEVGQIVNTLSSNGETIRTGGIDVSKLLPGAYSIQVKGESGLTTMRFVKQ